MATRSNWLKCLNVTNAIATNKYIYCHVSIIIINSIIYRLSRKWPFSLCNIAVDRSSDTAIDNRDICIGKLLQFHHGTNICARDKFMIKKTVNEAHFFRTNACTHVSQIPISISLSLSISLHTHIYYMYI